MGPTDKFAGARDEIRSLILDHRLWLESPPNTSSLEWSAAVETFLVMYGIRPHQPNLVVALIRQSEFDPVAYDILVTLIELWLDGSPILSGGAMPRELRGFARGVLRRKRAPPAKNPKQYRDLAIRHVVLLAVSRALELGMNVYGFGSEGACACVDDCLREFVVDGPSYEALTKIWQRHGDERYFRKYGYATEPGQTLIKQ